MRGVARLPAVVLALLVYGTPALAQGPVAYRLAVPSPEQRWMQVEIRLEDVPEGPLELHMSRSSPGRYALHDFASNVSNVEAVDGAGAALAVTHPSASEWRVDEHGPVVVVRYRVTGTRTDGTYLGIDDTHAHINMPASLMWARNFEEQPATVRFETAAARNWRVATQLWPGADARTFTAPNLQYLMDSPAELSAFVLRSFTVPDGERASTFRMAVHHQGTDAEVDELAAGAERVVREARNVFGEFPAFETGSYTFIADYLPTVVPDGMEHRNSTILTSRRSIRTDREDLLKAISHEFFHVWNVERIRPRSLEPFNLDEANPCSELWLAEGFTDYYGPLVLVRAGLTTAEDFASEVGAMVSAVRGSPARLTGTLEDMSRLATVVDGAAIADVVGLRSRFLSYYTWGGAVALGLDLTLRDRSDGRVTLDNFMRLLWQRYGKPGGRAPGDVDQPYTTADLEAALAIVSGDEDFARSFFARYIQGHDVIDYDLLLERAGFVWRSGGRGGAVLVPVEATGQGLTDAQRLRRTNWLTSQSR
jgi:predicted metalloprotease with PDZ domain